MRLGRAGVEERPAGGVHAGLAAFGEAGFDGLAARGELPAQVRGDAGHLGQASAYGRPLQAEVLGELAAQDGLVDVAGGELVAVEGGGVDGRPLPVLAAEQVGDHDVGVQLGVVGAAGTVLERGGDQPVAGDACGAVPVALPAAGAAGDEQLQIVHRLPDRGHVRLADLVGDLRVGQSVEDADALGRGEDDVVAGTSYVDPLVDVRQAPRAGRCRRRRRWRPGRCRRP